MDGIYAERFGSYQHRDSLETTTVAPVKIKNVVSSPPPWIAILLWWRGFCVPVIPEVMLSRGFCRRVGSPKANCFWVRGQKRSNSNDPHEREGCWGHALVSGLRMEREGEHLLARPKPEGPGQAQPIDLPPVGGAVWVKCNVCPSYQGWLLRPGSSPIWWRRNLS